MLKTVFSTQMLSGRKKIDTYIFQCLYNNIIVLDQTNFKHKKFHSGEVKSNAFF